MLQDLAQTQTCEAVGSCPPSPARRHVTHCPHLQTLGHAGNSISVSCSRMGSPSSALAYDGRCSRLLSATGTWHRPTQGQLVRLAKAYSKPHRHIAHPTWNPSVALPLTAGVLAAREDIPILEDVLTAARLNLVARVSSGPLFCQNACAHCSRTPLALSIAARLAPSKSGIAIPMPRAS